jgi:hypothetical protein
LLFKSSTTVLMTKLHKINHNEIIPLKIVVPLLTQVTNSPHTLQHANLSKLRQRFVDLGSFIQSLAFGSRALLPETIPLELQCLPLAQNLSISPISMPCLNSEIYLPEPARSTSLRLQNRILGIDSRSCLLMMIHVNTL